MIAKAKGGERMKTPTKTPVFSVCYGSFEECYKNKCTCKCHSQHPYVHGVEGSVYGSADTSKSDEEILKEFSVFGHIPSGRFFIDFKEIENYMEKKIALTREDCEKEIKRLQFVVLKGNVKAYNKAKSLFIEEGQKAEREKILEKVTKLRKNIHTTGFGRELLEWFEEELKKEVLKDER